MMSLRLMVLSVCLSLFDAATMSPSVSPAPSMTFSPTLKPTQFPTMLPATSGNASIAEALAIMIVMAVVGLFLGFGNVKQDYDRLQKKMKKILDYNAERDAWRQLLLPNAKPDDLEENIETFKEKYYPGDRVVVLERPPPEQVKAAVAVPISQAVPQSKDDKGIEMTEKVSSENASEKDQGGEKEEDESKKDAEEGEKGETADEKKEDNLDPKPKKEEGKDSKVVASGGSLFDADNDGELSADELRAAAEGIPRGRHGVVSKLVDHVGRYIIEFDDMTGDDEEGEEEEEEEESSDSDIDSEDETAGCFACIANGCQKPLTKSQKRAQLKRDQKKDRIIKVNVPKGAKPGDIIAAPTGRGDEVGQFLVPKHLRFGRTIRVTVPGPGSKRKLTLPKPAPLPKFSKKLYVYDIVGISCKIDQEVFAKYPDRDYDEEELDEIADSPNALFMILELFFFPLRVFLYELCCRVHKVKKIVAMETTAPVSLKDLEQEEEDGFIDGFPIDCGTKDRKYLSMAKCIAVTAERHPHVELIVDGEHYIKPYELYRDTGQHNLEWKGGEDCFKQYGCLRPKGFMQDYGIGMSLYFKFVKTLSTVFFFAACIAIFPICYYWQTSAWNASEKAIFLNNPSTSQKYRVFYTTVGSLGGTSYVCGNSYEDERMELSCQSGTIQRLEAYYGDPYGSCTCPNDQLPLTSTDRAGSCPADPNYKKSLHGECTAEYGNDDDNTGIMPCFKGQMWNGDTCCAYALHSDTHTVDLDKLAMEPNTQCNSASAQFILQGMCLGQTNCTVNVKANITSQWEVTARTPCGEGYQFWDDETNSLQCQSSFMSPSSNMTNCPALNNRRLIVRGLCSEDEFQSSGFGGGKTQKRAEWAKAVSYIDALITCIVFWAVLWMAEKENDAVYINDMHSCSVDDFTLRIMKLEPLKKGSAPDLELLKKNIKLHFDNLLKTVKPVILERPVKVVDINFGLNNQETIKNMKLRGALARMLDLQTEKMELMRMYGIHSEKEMIKQHEEVRIITVKFLEMCEKVKYRKTVLEARTAFVTFASEEGYERCKKLYCKNFWFGQPSRLKYKNKATFVMRPVMRPSDYIWEHLSTAPLTRFAKISTSNILACMILVIGFACIIRVKGVENSARIALGETDCTQFSFVYSGDPKWSSALNLNATKSETTRLDVAYSEYPDYYNNSYPIKGLLGCYCLYVNEQAPLEAQIVEFENPYSKKTDYLCEDFFTEYQYIQTLSTLAVGAVVVVNEMLKTVFRALVEFEGHETRTEEILAHTIKLFGSMLMNTAFIVVLIAGNLTLFLGGRNDSTTRVLTSANLMSGEIGDLNSEWYLEVGTAIVVTMYINIFALNTKVVQDSVKMKLMRCIDRGCTTDMTRTRQKLQVQLETLYTGPQLLLEERYAALLVGFFVCMIFSAGMPILWIVGFVTFLVSFCVDKWAFLRVYRLPPKYGPTLAQFATRMLPIGVLLHICFASWTFSSPEIFNYEGVKVEYSNSTDFDPRTAAYPYTNTSFQGELRVSSEEANSYDYWAPSHSAGSVLGTVQRAMLHPNTPPHVFLLCLWVAWFVTFKLLNFDYMVLWCMHKCAKKDADFGEANHAIMERQAEEKGVAVEEIGAAPEEVVEEVKIGDGGVVVEGGDVEAGQADTTGTDSAPSLAATALDSMVVSGPAIVSDEDPLHHHDADGKGIATQTAMKVSDQARITFDHMMGGVPTDENEKKQYEDRFEKFLELWKSESGVEAVEAFFPEEDKPTFDVAMESMSVDFRDRWLSMCEFIQNNRGHRAIEGNADYIWSIPSEDMTFQIHKGVLSVEMLAMFQKELAFRKEHPELYQRVTRRLQGILSYDYNANEEYVEAFALDSKSIKNYRRGNIQVSGADYELAQRGFVNSIVKCIAGARPLGISFPDISRDVHGNIARHTTQIGIVPTEITGPRFVLNLRVPPPPADLTAQDFNDPSYDEYAEKWQFLHVSVRGVFDYRLRLPRGLQHRKVPEIQIEIPAFEQLRSTVETTVIAGQVRSIHEQVQIEDIEVEDEEEKAEMRRLRKAQLKKMKEEQNFEVTAISAETVAGAETAEDLQRRQQIAASKIQAIIRKHQQKKKAASKMRSWQAVTLRSMESLPFLVLILTLVAIDIFLQLAMADEVTLVATVGYIISVFFLLELSLRFHCYSHVSRGDGVDCSDLDFFTSDKMRLLDLVIVILDWVGIIVLALSDTGNSSALGLRLIKGGRVIRIARLARFLRVARCLKVQMLGYDFGWPLTGKERMGMQRFHINAPKDVDKGNRIKVAIPTLGKVHIDFPLYSSEGTPIQFHLPVVCEHHLEKKVAPNCHIVKPDPIHCSEVEYRTTVGQLGWCNLWSPLDDSGLGLPYEKRGFFSKKKKVKGKDMDGDGIDDYDSNGIPLDARQQQVQRMLAGKDLAGGDGEGAREKMSAAYDKYYQDYTKHRVWYQVMAFAPRTVIKDFQNLNMFKKDLEPYKNAAVLTLRDGHYKGERIETIMKMGQGVPNGQKRWVHIPGVGDCEATLLAVDQVVMPGLHGIDCMALAVLPWGDRPVERKQFVPQAISEVTFDFPAILLPPAVEVVRKGMTKEQQEEAEAKEAEKEAREEREKEEKSGGIHLRHNFFHHHKHDANRVTGHTKEGVTVRFLERDTYIKTFEVKAKSRIAVEEALKKRQEKKERALKGFMGVGLSRAGRLALEKEQRAEKRAARAEKKRIKALAIKNAEAEAAAQAGDVEAPTDGAPKDPKDESIANEVETSIKSPPPAAASNVSVTTLSANDLAAARAMSVFSPKKTPIATPAVSAQTGGLGPVAAGGESGPAMTITGEGGKVPENGLDQSQVVKEMKHMKYEDHSTENISLPKVGRFHVTWPVAGEGAIAKHKARMAAFKVNFPAIKPHRHISEDVKALLPVPKDNNSLAASARRYQVGWVILEMPDSVSEGNEFKVYLRLPAFVSHRTRALAKLPITDEASPWNTSVTPAQEAGNVVTSPLLGVDSDMEAVKKQVAETKAKLEAEAKARAQFEAENKRLSEELAKLKSDAPMRRPSSTSRGRGRGVGDVEVDVGGRGGGEGRGRGGKGRPPARSSQRTAPKSPTGSSDSVGSLNSGINPLSDKGRAPSVDRPPPPTKKSSSKKEAGGSSPTSPKVSPKPPTIPPKRAASEELDMDSDENINGVVNM